FSLAPDWVCEVVSPATEQLDRAKKMPVYAREQVSHLWLVNPVARTLEVYRLADGRWLLLATYEEATRVRAEPFDAIELRPCAALGRTGMNGQTLRSTDDRQDGTVTLTTSVSI